jgi:hypothetical protein
VSVAAARSATPTMVGVDSEDVFIFMLWLEFEFDSVTSGYDAGNMPSVLLSYRAFQHDFIRLGALLNDLRFRCVPSRRP